MGRITNVLLLSNYESFYNEVHLEQSTFIIILVARRFISERKLVSLPVLFIAGRY